LSFSSVKVEILATEKEPLSKREYCIGNLKISSKFAGIIRKENIRDYDIDSVELEKSFLPGDIIKGKIVILLFNHFAADFPWKNSIHLYFDRITRIRSNIFLFRLW
jgi:hypothetical protein